MRCFRRSGLMAHIWLPGSGSIAVLASVVAMLVSAAPAPAAGFGVTEEHFEAGTCVAEACTYKSPSTAFYTQAAGHPPFGVTTFEFNSEEPAPGVVLPVGKVKNIRVDVPPGLAANPEAIEKCEVAKFESNTCPAGSMIGVNYLTVFTGVVVTTIPAPVYNLVQPAQSEQSEGLPLLFGIHVPVAEEHIFMRGHVSWATDYHEYFEINGVSEATPLLKSKLVFFGNAGTGFLTLPSECSASTTSHLRVESWKGEVSETYTHTPVGVENCEAVPFAPTLGLTPSTTQSDQPNNVAVSVELPQAKVSSEIDSSDLKHAVVTMPEGMTLNPSAANGLIACSNEQFGMKTTNPVSCPEASKAGTVKIETPNLPEPLTGNVYIGQPVVNAGPESGEEYRLFVDAESRYGVSVRLEGKVSANTTTGRLTTTFAENPQQPFSKFTLSFSGPHSPIANPLACGTATTTSVFEPYSGTPPPAPLSAFTVDADGKGGACAASPPFSLSQTAKALPTSGGSTSSLTFSLSRGDGQQYLQKVSTTLPPGMLAKIPSVPRCGEPLAREGRCPAESEIGKVIVSVGSGPTPYVLSGIVYLTGPFDGAPYGLSIVVPATKVGPYDYGNIVTQAAIDIDPFTTRVTVSSTLPTIVGGVPLRMKSLTLTIEHGNYLINPTNCSPLSFDTTLTSTMGATSTVSTPFQATGCSSLGFKPEFSAHSNSHTTKRYGASLKVLVSMPAGDANIKSVAVTLPKKLASRLSTLKLACTEKTFAANSSKCPQGSRVGSVTATTPTLPGTLTGPVYFVSHGGAAFPDLDLVLKGDGVTVILVGNTNISKNITHTTFATLPDAPITSFELKLPTGEKSALAANGNICENKIYMPTTIVAQNGKKITQKTRIYVTECPVRVVKHHIHGRSATITAATSAGGRMSTSGRDLLVIHKQFKKALGNAKIEAKLSPLGQRLLAADHSLAVKVRVGFKPSSGADRKESHAFVKLVFKS
jgi:hypothetical protein